MVFFPKTLGGGSFEKLVKHEGKEPIFFDKTGKLLQVSQFVLKLPNLPKERPESCRPLDSGKRFYFVF